MTSHRHRSRAVRAGAFSLLELLLTLVLLLLLLGAMAFSFSAMSDEAVFREAAGRTATLVHLARAHAATTGRRVQLAFQRDAQPSAEMFQPSLRKLAVLWEPDPILRPLHFEPLPAPSWDLAGINERVGVESAVIHGEQSGARLFLEAQPREVPPGADAADTSAVPPILFYPDGSSDSASITLASRAEEDRRRIRLDIQGLTGDVQAHSIEDRGTPAPGLPPSPP